VTPDGRSGLGVTLDYATSDASATAVHYLGLGTLSFRRVELSKTAITLSTTGRMNRTNR
jgi:hypothetical protein